MSDFETALNTGLHEGVFDNTTMAVGDMLGGGAIATVVDTGASIWNSVTPESMNVQTSDLLKDISTSALKVYQQNPDTIHTASFIAGMFLPMGPALKGMSLLRQGAKGISWFGNVERASELARITELTAGAAEATSAYRSTMLGIYAKTAVNQAIDGIAMEAALVGTMNAHPFMEDYMKDLKTNFTIGAMLGGGLGAGAGLIADRFAIQGAKSVAYEEVYNTVKGAIASDFKDMTNATQMASHEATIKNLDEIISAQVAKGKTTSNDLLLHTAEYFKLNVKADQVDLFKEMVSPDILKLANEEQDKIMRTIIDNPSMLGVENIRFLTAKEVEAKGFIKAPKFDLQPEPSFQANASSKGPILPKAKEAVYFPELGVYGTKDDAIHYAGAAVYGKTAEQLSKDIGRKLNVPNYDSNLELLSKSSAEIQKEYIGVWEKVKNMNAKEIAALHIGDGDGPLLNAAIWKLATDPELAGVQVKFSSNLPIMKQIVKEHVEKLVQEGKITAQEAATAGPDAAYYAKLKAISDDIHSEKYVPGKGGKPHPGGSNMASISSVVGDWIGGDKMPFNRMAVDHLAAQNRGFAASGINQENVREFDKIYNAKESKELRRRFSEIADAEGNVYLYRGWDTNTIKGQQPLDSFTTDPGKASAFIGDNIHRGVKLYKVPVDDIVAGFRDIGDRGKNNAEVIVRASARIPVAELSKDGKIALKKKAEASVTSSTGMFTTTKTTITKETVEEGVKKVGVQELHDAYVAQKQDALNTFLDAGFPIESIAIKTNTDPNVVKAWAAIRQNVDSTLADLIPPNQSAITSLNGIKRYDEIADVLGTQNQPMVLSSNFRKNPLYVLNAVALDQKLARTLNAEFSFLTMVNSKSETAKELGMKLRGEGGYGPALDVISSKIGLINNAAAGSAIANSFDFYTRNMKDIGAAVSTLGKEVQRVAANTISKVMEPIQIAMSAVQKDAAAMVEFSTFYNVNAGLKGWRSLDNEGYLVQKVIEKDVNGKNVEILKRVNYTAADGAQREYRVASDSVKELINSMQAQSQELRELSNTINRLKGSPNINDIGLWMPSFNPIDKHIAYVHDKIEGKTRLLWAKSEPELISMMNKFKENIAARGMADKIEIVTRNEQAMFNKLNGRLDPITMERADIGLQKGGSTESAIIKPDPSIFGELAKGYEFYITSQVRNLADLGMYEITDALQRMSQFNRRYYEGQPFSAIKKIVAKPKDAAAVMRNTLLGNSNLGEYEGWKAISNSFETGLEMSSNVIAGFWNSTFKPLGGLLTKKDIGQWYLEKRTINPAGETVGSTRKALKEEEAKNFTKTESLDSATQNKIIEEPVFKTNRTINFEELNQKMEAKGIIYPWKGMDEATARQHGYFNIEATPGMSKRVVYASNALAATVALRLGELAQPLVNAMSLPVLTGLAIRQNMPETFMGVQKATANAHPVQIMYEGVRAMNSTHFASLNKRWEEAGYFSPMVSEVSDIMRATRKGEKGLIAKVEDALESKFVEVMSKPADLTESITRKVAMNTGAVLAKRLYPELDELGVTIFARDFMDKAIGNFHAAQRPVMFQGTLGVALGLFQTYMWTMGQSIYRHLEYKNFRALGEAALTQSTIFGTSSLPGFQQVSQMIGEHFSDQNFDLTTGTYRATGDKMADFILYGLPSNLGPTFSTRGDVNPRFPNVLAGADNVVAVNFLKQATESMAQVKDAMSSDFPDMARALAQGLSVQSLSRPIARAAELATGYSVTKPGNTVQVPEEAWTFTGIASRIMGTRPIEEQKLREADHLNHYYGAIDRDNREKLLKQLKTSIRGGSLNDEKLSKMSEEYFRHGGSPSGWRAAVNKAIATTEEPGVNTMIQKLKPDSPLHHMIDSLER